MADILVAKVAFHTTLNGAPLYVSEGTTVREGHPLLKGRGDLFGPMEVDYEHKSLPAKAAAKIAAPKFGSRTDG